MNTTTTNPNDTRYSNSELASLLARVVGYDKRAMWEWRDGQFTRGQLASERILEDLQGAALAEIGAIWGKDVAEHLSVCGEYPENFNPDLVSTY